ncbi:hypothetical protein BDV97DRAFT_401806 [Delphinella strobiligena]|nr:hypothetical protein BDV97DRAFT_401806 [Delphinella strobiligena]
MPVASSSTLEKATATPTARFNSPAHRVNQRQQRQSEVAQSQPQHANPPSHTPQASAASFRSYAPAPSESQESLMSSTDGQGRVLAAPSSNVGSSSNATVDTAATSPLSPLSQQSPWQNNRLDMSAGQWVTVNSTQTVATSGSVRVRTPEEQGERSNGFVSPTTRHKRTANGLVKAGSAVSPVLGSLQSPTREKRAESVSSSGSKAGEAAAQLKTRLAYAMAKVQHGWQNHNLDQVEVLAASLPTRTSASSPTPVPARINRGLVSPRTALSKGASRFSMQEARQLDFPSVQQAVKSPPSKRRSGAGIVSWAGADTIIPSSHSHRRTNSSSIATSTPSLAPAPDITPLAAPPSQPPSHVRNMSNANAGPTSTKPSLVRNDSAEDHQELPQTTAPRTPRKEARPHPGPMVPRTNSSTNQAEQDAMQALMMMTGSPSRSEFPSNPFQPISSSQPTKSPQRHALEPQSSSQPLSSPSRHQILYSGVKKMSPSKSSSRQPHSSPLRHKFSDADLVRKTLGRMESSTSTTSSGNESSSDGASLTREGRERLLDEFEESAS